MDINITLISVLLIILLFIPGFFFKRFYYIGQFTKQFSSGSFAERFVTNMFWGLIIQIICLSIASQFVKSDYKSLWTTVNKFYTQVSESKLPDCNPTDLKHGMFYILFSVVIAILLGTVLHYLVRLLRIDRRFTVLRFANYWNYYFRGDISGIRPNNGRVVSTVLDLLVEDKAGGTKIYRGFLTDYHINTTTGELETVALTQALRFSKTKNSFTQIPGDTFIVPYSTVLNMNVSYNVVSRNTTGRLTNAVLIATFIGYIGGSYFAISTFPVHVGWFRTILAVVIGFFVALMFVVNLIVVIEPVTAPNRSKFTVKQKISATLMLGLAMLALSYGISLLLGL